MKLTEEQIATLVLAFHEGELTAAQRIELDAYLLANPDFQEELNDFILLTPDEQFYKGPTLLKNDFDQISIYASETGHPYEKLAVGVLENELAPNEKRMVESLQQDQHFLEVQHQMAMTKLKPDLHIVYPRTAQLLQEIPLRRINQKFYYYVASAAAALISAVFLINQQSVVQPKGALAVKDNIKKNTGPKEIQTPVKATDFNLSQQVSLASNFTATDVSEQTFIELQHVQESSVPNEIQQNNSYLNPGVLATIDPIVNEHSDQISPSQVENPTVSNQRVMPSKAFIKEPVTVKTFLLQKTNERLFGAAAPSADLRYETMARYANQTIGIPVRYEVEEGDQRDKIVFQIGPFSLERSRSKK